jgi:hypothetical protein
VLESTPKSKLSAMDESTKKDLRTEWSMKLWLQNEVTCGWADSNGGALRIALGQWPWNRIQELRKDYGNVVHRKSLNPKATAGLCEAWEMWARTESVCSWTQRAGC